MKANGGFQRRRPKKNFLGMYVRSGDCPKDYLSEAPPSDGAERTENFENGDPSDSRKWHFQAC